MGRARRAGAGAGARSAGNRDRERVIAGHEREGGAEERAEEGTEEWWAALVHVLGQPSEVRRRAAWEAVAGTAGVGGARLEWAVVEARVRAAERAAMRLVGPAGASGAGRSVKIWTGDKLIEAMARGGEVDLGGTEVELTGVLGATGAEKVATIRNGTLWVSSANAGLGKGYGLIAGRGGEMRLEGVRVVGTGVWCEEGGRVTLVNTHVADAPNSSVMCLGRGNEAVVQGGCITGSKEGHGVCCVDGGQVELQGVEVADCKLSCLTSQGQGSSMMVKGGRIVRSTKGFGVQCIRGGQAKMWDAEIADCKQAGVICHDRGSRVVVQGSRITGSKEGHGVICQDGGHMEGRDVVIADCKHDGLVSTGRGSKAVVQGGRIVGS